MYFTLSLKETLQRELLEAARTLNFPRIRRIVNSRIVDISFADEGGNTALSYFVSNFREYQIQNMNKHSLMEMVRLLTFPGAVFNKQPSGSSLLFQIVKLEDPVSLLLLDFFLEQPLLTIAARLTAYAELSRSLKYLKSDHRELGKSKRFVLQVKLADLLKDDDIREIQTALVIAKQVKDASVEAAKKGIKEHQISVPDSLSVWNDAIPSEVSEHILSFLSVRDLVRVSRVDRSRHYLASSPRLALHKEKVNRFLADTISHKAVHHIRTLLLNWNEQDSLPSELDIYDRELGLKIVETLLIKCLPDDKKMIALVDRLLQRFKTSLPSSLYVCTSFAYATVSDSIPKFYLTLKNHPESVEQYDEDRKTLLHHSLTAELTSNGVKNKTLERFILLRMPNISFNLQDIDGDTPLHIAVSNCYFLEDYLGLHEVVRQAANSGFDFSILNQKGLTVLHLAASSFTRRNPGMSEQMHSVLLLAETIPTLDLDILSAAGKTALYYLIAAGDYRDALELIKLGANPLIGGVKAIILQHIEQRKAESSAVSYNRFLSRARNSSDDLKVLHYLLAFIENEKLLSEPNPSAKERMVYQTPSGSRF